MLGKVTCDDSPGIAEPTLWAWLEANGQAFAEDAPGMKSVVRGVEMELSQHATFERTWHGNFEKCLENTSTIYTPHSPSQRLLLTLL